MFNKKSRLQTIEYDVNKLIPNDYMNKLMDEYSDLLSDYQYIDNIIDFSLLPLRGALRYINKYDKKIRYGGLLIKIYQKNNDWIGIIKKYDDTKIYVSFNSNYIFYCKNKFNNNLSMFITDVENNKYDIV
jgi:hypothetical protein